MAWPAIFFAISFYFWFLLILPTLAGPLPVFYYGPGGFLLLCLIPVFAAYRLNRLLVRFRRTAGGVIALNGLLLLLILAVSLAASGRLQFIPPAGAGSEHWAAWLIPSGWQILSWLTGAGFAGSGSSEGGAPPGERANQANLSFSRLSTALLIAAPPIFLLDTTHYPPLFPGGIVACWFITMVITLALERSTGENESGRSLVLIHGLTPLFAGIVFTSLAFSSGFRVVLETLRLGLSRLLAVILYLLSQIGSTPPAQPAKPSDLQPFYFQERAIEATSALHPLVLTFMLVLFLALAVLTLACLAALSMRTLERIPGNTPVEPVSPLKMLRQAWFYMLKLILMLTRVIHLAALRFLTAGKGALRWLNRAWREVKPPVSASEAVYRSYRSFLKWNRRRTGLAITPAQTAGEYLRQIEKSAVMNVSRLEPIRELTTLFAETRYSGRRAGAQQAARCRELLNLIREKQGR